MHINQILGIYLDYHALRLKNLNFDSIFKSIKKLLICGNFIGVLHYSAEFKL